jgi:hypothetical protein
MMMRNDWDVTAAEVTAWSMSEVAPGNVPNANTRRDRNVDGFVASVYVSFIRTSASAGGPSGLRFVKLS